MPLHFLAQDVHAHSCMLTGVVCWTAGRPSKWRRRHAVPTLLLLLLLLVQVLPSSTLPI
jgi:hypothetical protein